MGYRVQRIGHTTGVANLFTGKDREITIDTSRKQIRVHDGITPGGYPHALAAKGHTPNNVATLDSAGNPIDGGRTVVALLDTDNHTDGATNGVYTLAERAKLSNINLGATSTTGAEIKALYEAEADTNAYDDAAVAKLAGIEAAATADQTGAEIKVAYEAEADTNAFTDALLSKLNAVETGATADQTKADIDALGINAASVGGYSASSIFLLAGGNVNYMAFYQAAAPLGWTQKVDLDDAMFRLVSGVGGVSGGTDSPVTGLSTTDGHALTAAENGAHTHAYTDSVAGTAGLNSGTGLPVFSSNSNVNRTTGSSGSGDAHAHGVTWAPKYVSLILASKD